MKRPIEIGADRAGKPVSIDLDGLVQSRLLVQANSGAGKTWLLRRLAEQSYGKLQHLVIDVEGEFHTLREKHDYVLARAGGGGDCPADPRTAAVLARRLLELQASAVLDIFDLQAHDRVLFVRRFLEAMMTAPRSLWRPCLVLIDEAHLFAPEKGSAESSAAVIDLMTRGRKRAFCGVLATQRISRIAKDAIAEANNKLIGRTALDVDMKRAAEELGFTGREDMLRLRTRDNGEFFAFGPAISREIVDVIVGPVVTSHGKLAKAEKAPPAPTAKVRDILSQLGDLVKEAEEEARTVEQLRGKVTQLERELRAAQKGSGGAPAQADPAKLQAEYAHGYGRGFAAAMKQVAADRTELLSVRRFLREVATKAEAQATAVETFEVKLTERAAAELSPPPPRDPKPTSGSNGRSSTNGRDRQTTGYIAAIKGQDLGKGELQILTAIAQHGHSGVTREQLTVLTGYKRSSRDTYLQRLRTAGYIGQTGPDGIAATEEGIAALGPDFEPLPTGERLREYWLQKLGGGEREILWALVSAWPAYLSRDRLTEATGYKRSSRDTYLQRLRSRQLVETSGSTVRASEVLFADT